MDNHSRDIEDLQQRRNRMKAWVTSFSAGGVTARLAARLAKTISAPLYEIKPAMPSTRADLNSMDKQSGSFAEA